MPTHKQRNVARILSENPRKSVSAAMREAGYSDRSAEKPQELTKSRGWQELIAESLPNEKLLQVHVGLLDSSDWRARALALDKAYKLRSLYNSPEENRNAYDNLSLQELDALLEQFESFTIRAKKYGRKKITTQSN